MKKYRFDLNSLLPVSITVIIVALVVAYGLQIMGETRTDILNGQLAASCGQNSTGGTGGTILYTACDASYNATTEGLTAVAKIPTKLGTIVTVILAVVVIGVLIYYFGKRLM